MKRRLEKKVAIVTGGAQGLGREIATLYAEQGAQVVVADIAAEGGADTAAAIRAAGGEADFVETNVADSAQVQALIDHAERRFGGLHIMTANAGIAAELLPFAEVPEETFNRIVNVNFTGTWLCLKHAIPAIQRSGGGAMSATGSIASDVGIPGTSAYSASKGAILALVRALSTELRDIRVNVVSPGTMRTDIVAHSAGAAGASADDAVYSSWGRAAHPREVANAHLFVVSDEGSFMNGANVVADGGKSAAVVGAPDPRGGAG